MQTIFIFLYEGICGKNQNIPDYRERIFGSVGLLTLLIAIAIGLLFYVALGRWKNFWYTRTHWFITIVICAVIGFGLAYGIAKSIIGSADGYLTVFALVNAFVIVVYFFVVSLLLKSFSIYSRRTPF
jgi:hypothetical protein